MRWCLCVCLLALFSLDEVICKKNRNSFSLEPDEEHEPVRNTMNINNPDEEYEGGSGAISIEGSGSPSPIGVIGSGEQEVLVLNLRVTEINGKKAVFSNSLLDNETPIYAEMEQHVCNAILRLMESEVDMNCRVLAFSEGSIVAKTELTVDPSSIVSPEAIEIKIKAAANSGTVGALTIDPKSIVLKTPFTTVKMTSTDAPEIMTKGVILVDATIKADLKEATTNEFVFETQDTTTNQNGVEPTKTPEVQTFIDKLFNSPVMLAGMVGAAVLILLTIILVSMFVVYRVKKKDEGSYSLDEPNKMKDPQAYWKDTKEFYA